MRYSAIGGLVTLALTILLAPLAAHGQAAAHVPRIGFLSPINPDAFALGLERFRQGLHEYGYVEGQNMILEYRFADGKLDRLPTLAAELVHLKVDVIVALGPAVMAAKDATSSIPIVMAGSLDAVAAGFVHSLARPGGNITGLTLISTDLMGKRLQLLKETLPHLSRLAVIGGPTVMALLVPATEGAAQALGVTLQILQVRQPDDITPAWAAITRERVEALYVMATLFVGLPQVIDLAVQRRLPTFCALRACVDLGGLMSYGPNIAELSRGLVRYVDRILKGAKPADLPVEQPLTFELVINLKTAKALGLTLPSTLLFQADEVIQ